MNSIRPFGAVHPRVDPSAWVDPSAVVIGDVTLGPDASIWPLCASALRVVMAASTNFCN